MNYTIEESVIAGIREQIDPHSTAEECFVLLGKREDDAVLVDDFVKVPNSHEEPEDFYQIRKSDVPEEVLPRVVGAAHTHIKGQMKGVSYDDVSLMKPGQIGAIFYAPTGRCTIYDATGFLEVI